MNRYAMQRMKYRQKARQQRVRTGGNGVLLLFILFVLVIGYGFLMLDQDSEGISRGEEDKVYSPRQLRKDFDFLLKTLEDVHPDLYAFVSREEIKAERERIEATLDIPMTRLEFYRHAAPIVSRFNDGHTFAQPPEREREEYAEQGALLFPLDLRFAEDAVRVSRNYTSDSLVAPGTQVLEINGLPVELIEDRLLHYVSGERLPWKRELLNDRFRWQLWLVFGIESPYEVTILRTTPRGSTRLTRTFLGLTNDELTIRSKARQEQEPTAEAFSYRELNDPQVPRVGVIDFNRFEDLEGFTLFLDSTFRDLREREIEDLIIDLRGNGGGDSQLGDKLIDFIYDQPFRQVSRMDVKVSRQVKKYYSNWVPWYYRWYPPLEDEFFQRVWEAREGEVVSFELPLNTPSEMPFRFEGDIHLLIDSGTFSSAALFAATVKDYGIGTLVGEETGGLANTFGELYPFRLPETRLVFAASSKKFLRPSEVDDGSGVLPDVTIDPAQFARRPVDDMAIATTLNLIREKRLER